jgi:phosphatidate cytidylyltransferase
MNVARRGLAPVGTTNFVSRLTVVAIGLPVVLAAAYYGGWWLFVAVALAGLLALDELYRAGRQFRPLVPAGYAGLLACFFGVELGGAGWLGAGVAVTLPLAFVLVLFAETRQSAVVSLSFTVLGVAWIGLGLSHVLLLRSIPENGRLALFTVLLAIFATDTAAYLFGRVLGRRKLAPTLSPGKSWEGFVAGAVAGVFTTWVALYKQDFADGWQSLVLGVVIVVAATFGDLLQSLFKRDVGIKDTGRLLGGHGGVFDRIDSILVAVPAAFWTLVAFDEAFV